jgi:hypothetical protein
MAETRVRLPVTAPFVLVVKRMIISAYEAEVPGSNPGEDTSMLPSHQRTGHIPPKDEVQVRFLPGAPAELSSALEAQSEWAPDF